MDLAYRDTRTNSSDRDDRRGALGKHTLEAGKVHRLYTPIKDKTRFSALHINIANCQDLPEDGALTKTRIRLWISEHENPVLGDLIEPNIELKQGEVFTRFGDLISMGEYLYACADGDSIVVRITGVEDRLP